MGLVFIIPTLLGSFISEYSECVGNNSVERQRGYTEYERKKNLGRLHQLRFIGTGGVDPD